MAFHLYAGNRMEDLAEIFAERLYRAPLPDGSGLLTPRTVVVQTRGTAGYLEQYLAGRAAVAANLEMPFLNSFVHRVLRAVYGAEFRRAEELSAPENMRWRIMRILSGGQRRYPELAHYLDGPDGALKRWQLAGRAAELFDQYQIYRYDRMEELWRGRGGDGAWQKRLYGELFAETPGRDHFYRRFLREKSLPEGRLPRRVAVFGVGAMPPVHLKIFRKLSEVAEVHFFYLSPCREYWAHQYSRREAARLLEPWETQETGNPLLQALGGAGRGFFTALLQEDWTEFEEELCYRDFAPAAEPGADGYGKEATMLQVMQQDILNLFDRRPHDAGEAELVGTPCPEKNADDTIAVHNCHSMRREIEVLHDELLRVMRDPAVKPRDVIVMAPDMERYVPLIQAVFDQGPLRGAYTVADRPPPDSMLMLDAFHRLLETARGRFELSEVLALLDTAPLAERLRIGDSERSQLAEWALRAGIRWGFDAAHREQFCAAEFDEYSWRMGLDRLLMGLARRVPEPGVLYADGIAGLAAAEGQDAELLGKFAGFAEQLARLARLLKQPRSVAGWCVVLERVLADFFPDGNAVRTGLADLRQALARLNRNGSEALHDELLPLNTVLAMLDDLLPMERESRGFLRGRITFCKMLPMRSVPMAVVAVLGLNDKEFPRRDLKLGFNLAAERELPGDRSQAALDRYLLLEALLAARREVWFFYCGQSARSDKEFPPAAPLGEIMEYCRNAFGLKEIKHKLSGVDLDYFGLGNDPRRRSFNRMNYLAARRGAERGRDGAASAECPPLRPVPREKSVDLAELAAFFRNPGKYLLERQLSMHLTAFAPETGGDAEPWSLDALGRYALNEMLERWLLDDVPEDVQYHLADRMNLLAPGEAGRREFKVQHEVMRTMPETWRGFLKRSERRLLALELPEMDLTVKGWSCNTPDGRTVYHWRCGAFDARTALPAVLGQLGWTVCLNVPVTGRMLNLEKGGFVEHWLPEIAPGEARRLLLELLECYYAIYPVKPPPIFPRASLIHALGGRAREAFVGNAMAPGDCEQPGIREFYTAQEFCDDPETPFGEAFAGYAELLYGRIQDGPAGGAQ